MPLHPVLVHLPLGLVIVIPALALAFLLAVRRRWLPAKAWWAVAALQALLLAGGVAALRSGEADEERAEQRVPEAAIEAHEEAAGRFVIGAGAVLALALLPLVARRESWQTAGRVATVAGSLAVLGLGIDVGHKGGELVYRHGAAAAAPGTPADQGAPESDDDD